MDTYLSEVKTAIESGDWRSRTWWRSPLYQTDLKIGLGQIEEAFTALSKIFSKSWAIAQIDSIISEAKKPVTSDRAISPWESLLREKLAAAQSRYDEYYAASSICGAHPIFGHLFHRGGLDTFMFLYGIGSNLKSLKREILGDLPGRMSKASEFEGASAELKFLASWAAVGINLKRHVPGKGKKNCDLKISDGENAIYVEVKRLESSPTNKERSSLTDALVSSVLAQLHARGLDGLFEMELLLRPANRGEVKQTTDCIEQIANMIIRDAEQRADDKSGAWRVVDGLAKYRHIADKSRGTFGGTAGLPLDERAEADKIMDEVRDHADQIPEKGPGLFVIMGSGNRSLTLFGPKLPERIAERFMEDRTAYADVSGVLILRSLYSLEDGEVEIPLFVPNPLGPRLSIDLLKRGVPNLQKWPTEEIASPRKP